MNRLPVTLVIVFLLLICPSARADLSPDVGAILHDKILSKAEVGIEIVRLGPSKAKSPILFRHNSDIPLIPASNMKIATTSAFLEKLGPDFKFRTMLLRRGEDLILVGDGDPTLGDAEMLRKSNWDVTTLFANWADELKKQNITTVQNILVDDSVFDENFAHHNWPVKQQHLRYVAQVGGINLNANCLDFFLKIGNGGETVSYTTDPETAYATIRNTCVTGRQ